MTLLKKTFLSFLTSLVILFSFAPYLNSTLAVEDPGDGGTNTSSGSTSAGGTWYNSSFSDWYGKVYDPDNPTEIFGERYTAAQVQWVVYGIFSFLVNSVTGPENSGLVQCFLTNTADIGQCTQELSKLITAVNQATQALNTPQDKSLASLVFAERPLSGISYVREKATSFSIVPTAKAQDTGFGFDALKPVQSMWRGFRDISYGLFVIVAVVFAFMIMFRVKISPQVVISVQSAIPQIIIAMVLATFSYAIAGFMIDLMYVVIGLISLVGPSLTSFPVSPPTLFNILTSGSPGGVLPGGIIVTMGLYLFLLSISFFALFGLMLGGVLGGATALATGALLYYTFPISFWIMLLIFVIIVIVLLWMIIRVLWGLLKAFVNVLLLTIFAPLQFTLGVLIPNFGFSAWLKSYFAALSTFVVTGVLMLMSWVFLINGVSLGLSDALGGGFLNVVSNAFLGTGITGALFEGTSFAWPPLLGSGNSGSGVGLLYLGVSFVMFTLIPKATEIVQGFITGKPFAYGSAIGEAFGPVGGIYSRTIGQGVGAYQKYGSEQMTVNLLTSLNKEMTSGRLQWIPQGIKDFVDTGAKSKPQPFH